MEERDIKFLELPFPLPHVVIILFSSFPLFFPFYQFQIKLETRTHPLVFPSFYACIAKRQKKKKKKLKNILKNCQSCAHLASSPFSLVMHRLSMILKFSCIPNLRLATIPSYLCYSLHYLMCDSRDSISMHSLNVAVQVS